MTKPAWGLLLVSLFKGKSGCEQTRNSPPPSPVGLYRKVIAWQRGSLKTQSECKLLCVVLVFVGDCVCVGATLALRDVGVGLIFFGNSYLPGCVRILRLAGFCVSVSSNAERKQRMALTLKAEAQLIRSEPVTGSGASFPQIGVSEFGSQCTHTHTYPLSQPGNFV